MTLPEAIILFGGSGFIGRNLLDRLADLGVRTIGVNRSGAPMPGCVETATIDGLDRIAALPAEVVAVNVAAHRYDASRFGVAQSEILLRNVEMATAVYHFCAERGIREMRLASSVAVYPEGLDVLDDGVPIDLHRMVALTSTNAHRIFGLKTKGRLRKARMPTLQSLI